MACSSTVFWGASPVGFSTAVFTSIEEREGVEIALRVSERVLVERIAGMHGDGPRHRLRARVFEARQQHVADKDLRPFVDVEDHIDLVGIGGLGLLRHGHCRLIEAAAQILRDQRIVIAGQSCGAKASGPAWCSAARSKSPWGCARCPSICRRRRAAAGPRDAIDHLERRGAGAPVAAARRRRTGNRPTVSGVLVSGVTFT